MPLLSIIIPVFNVEKIGMNACKASSVRILTMKNMPDEKRNNIFVMVTSQKEKVAQAIMDQLIKLGIDESRFASRIY